MAFRFLNIDFELLSRGKPAAFLRGIRHQTLLLSSADTGDGWLTSFEINVHPCTPVRILSAVKRLFAALTARARAEWDAASKREFDFGYDLTGADRIQKIDVPARFVAFAASVNATLRMTIYDENHSELKSRDT